VASGFGNRSLEIKAPTSVYTSMFGAEMGFGKTYTLEDERGNMSSWRFGSDHVPF